MRPAILRKFIGSRLTVADEGGPLYSAGGLGFLHEAAGVGDKVGDFEGFYQTGDALFLQEAAHFRLGDAGEGEQQMFLHARGSFPLSHP